MIGPYYTQVGENDQISGRLQSGLICGEWNKLFDGRTHDRKPDTKLLSFGTLWYNSYHYVLPTQLLAKCVDHRLDTHALQAGYDAAGAFDARTVAHGVIVPFDRAHASSTA